MKTTPLPLLLSMALLFCTGMAHAEKADKALFEYFEKKLKP